METDAWWEDNGSIRKNEYSSEDRHRCYIPVCEECLKCLTDHLKSRRAMGETSSSFHKENDSIDSFILLQSLENVRQQFLLL